jgi:hypothetical protein
MPKLTMKKGTTGKILRVRIQAATTGNPIPGLVYNSSGLAAAFIREGDSTATAISLVAGTVGTWSSGGFKEVDSVKFPGTYELGAPNAALTGANSVYLEINGYSGMLPVPFEIQLDATDNQDAVRGGMTALPSANAGANGGLPTGDASGKVALQTAEHTAVQADATAALNAAMPGSPTAGSLFAVAKTNLDAAVSSRSTFAGGAVASVAAGVTLASGEHTAIAVDVQTGLTAQGYTTARAPKIDNLDAAITTRSVFSGGAVASVTTPVTLAASEHTAIAADVLDAAGSSHNITGSIGAKINSAGSASDPLASLVPGSYASGTAGNILGNRLDAAISTRQSGSAAVTLPSTPPAGYLASDVVTAIQNTDDWKSMRQILIGRFTYDPDAGTLTVFDTDATTILNVYTLTVSDANVITERVVTQ